MKIHVLVHLDHFEISDHNKLKLKQAVKDNGKPIRAILETITPESEDQRGYLEGGLIPLLVYLDGNDYRDSGIVKFYREEYKKEFYPEVVMMNGKAKLRGKSSKGSKALKEFIDKLQDFLDEQYGISHDNKAISPDEYKKFRDDIYPFDTKYEDYISYCREMKYIK